MHKLETLNNMAHLQRSRFGRPHPRHGLRLLYWFANDCLSFDNSNNMTSDYDPENEDFGFHLFENRYDRNGFKLLPDGDLPYYAVGNLNLAGADDLPYYVRKDYTDFQENSNMDRIIVSLDCEWFDRVYVSEHYDPDATYRISKGLLQKIRKLELNEFLTQAGCQGYINIIYQEEPYQDYPEMIYNHTTVQPPDPRPIKAPASNVRPQNMHDCRIEIEASSESECESDSFMNDRSTVRYPDSGTNRRRTRCCECTIL